MRSLTLASPAKLNLYLKIVRRRPDGCHELITLFHRISLQDKITLTPKKTGYSLTAAAPSKLSLGEDNLITKAYRLLQRNFKGIGGVAVHLEKNIPIGGGLGGGSSNAAAFLLGMKKLFDLQIARQDLARLGTQLGADVPFFIYDITQAVASGIGEQIEPLPTKASQAFLLVISKRGLSTQHVYKNVNPPTAVPSLTRLKGIAKLLGNLLQKRKLEQAAGLLENDLEEPAFQLKPSLRKTISTLNGLGIKAARMSGSGPTVFGILSRPNGACNIAQKLQRILPSKKIIVVRSY